MVSDYHIAFPIAHCRILCGRIVKVHRHNNWIHEIIAHEFITDVLSNYTNGTAIVDIIFHSNPELLLVEALLCNTNVHGPNKKAPFKIKVNWAKLFKLKYSTFFNERTRTSLEK